MDTKYPKIETLFERDAITRKVNPAMVKNPAYELLKTWHWTEKVDGTNVRVLWQCADGIGALEFRGRSDNAQLHLGLHKELFRLFDPQKLRNLWSDVPVVLYGEGYGAGIQRGGGYRPDQSFVLFDVLVAGKYWLTDENMRDTARTLGIDAVPSLGDVSLPTAVELVRGGFQSHIPGATCPAEGVVGKPRVPLFDQHGQRLVVKLKSKDLV
jgi:hypothetical protein